MLTPILSVRTATGPAEETSSRPQQPTAPVTAVQRGEAIQKILDALTRHLAGREILPKDTLVRLMEDLARILKFPPLPQEGGRDFVRRLVTFLESMPMAERMALERQLGGRSLALRVSILADLPAIRNGAGSVSAGTPSPAASNPSLQPAIPLHLAAARTPVAGEVALLQAVLKKTFGVGNDSDVTSLTLEDADPTLPTDDGVMTSRQAAPERGEAKAMPGRLPSLDGPQIEALAAIVNGEADPETAEPQSTADATPTDDADNGASRAAETAEDGDVPARAREAAARNGAVGADAGPDGPRTDDGQEADGTYRPLPDGEDDLKDDRSTTRNNESRTNRTALSDTLKTIVRDTLRLPGEPAGVGRPGVAKPEPESAETQAAAHQPEADGTEPGRAAPMRPRDMTAGAELAALNVTDDQTEQAGATGTNAAQRLQKAADDPAIQQAIARLVENGLPREAIPFAMIPYPIAAEDVKSETARSERDEGRDESGEDGTAQGDGEATEEEAPKDGHETDDRRHEVDDGQDGDPDVYELYRKLGGLG